MLTRYWLLIMVVLGVSPAQAGPSWNYLLHCAGCHLENGAGTPPEVPDMRAVIADFVMMPEGRAYLGRVPGVMQAPLDDRELAELLNWMVQRFSVNEIDYSAYTEADIAGFRHQPLYDPLQERKRLLDKLRNTQ